MALVVEGHGGAIEGERPRGQIHDRLEHPVEVERGGDLPADVEQHREVAGSPLRGVGLGVAERVRGRRGETLEQVAVVLVERRRSRCAC